MSTTPLQPLIVTPDDVSVFGKPPSEQIRILLGKKDTGGAFSLAVGEVPPGAGQPLHTHQYEDETFCILEGELEMQVGDERRTANAGTVVFLPKEIPHTYSNCSHQTAKVMVIITPGGFEEFVLESEALTAQGEPDMEAILALSAKYGIEMVGPPLVTAVA